MTISQKRSGSLASLCCFRTLTLFFPVRPLIPTQLFSVLSFFRPVDDDKLITRVRQQHKTQKQPEQEARDCPNPFFWYATVYAQPAQALAMFAPDVFPLSGAFCLNKRLRHRLGRNSIGTLAKKNSPVSKHGVPLKASRGDNTVRDYFILCPWEKKERKENMFQ